MVSIKPRINPSLDEILTTVLTWRMSRSLRTNELLQRSQENGRSFVSNKEERSATMPVTTAVAVLRTASKTKRTRSLVPRPMLGATEGPIAELAFVFPFRWHGRFSSRRGIRGENDAGRHRGASRTVAAAKKGPGARKKTTKKDVEMIEFALRLSVARSGEV